MEQDENGTGAHYGGLFGGIPVAVFRCRCDYGTGVPVPMGIQATGKHLKKGTNRGVRAFQVLV
jgi:hypothetical protein